MTAATTAATKAQFATAYTVRATVSLLIGTVWLLGGFIAMIALSIDERLRCLSYSSSYCYESGGQVVPITIGAGVFIIGVIVAIVFNVKANAAKNEANAAVNSIPADEPETTT